MAEKNILSSAKVVVLTLVFVKCIGFIKQAVIAAYYGTSGAIDQFLLVSELMENIGAAIFSAISISFLTIYVEIYTKEGREGSSRLVSNAFAFFIPIVFLLIILVTFFSDQIANVIAPGYTEAQSQLVSKYIKLFSVTILMMLIFYLCNAVLEAEKVFFPGKIVGVIRSVTVILAIVFLSNKMGINAMLVGVMTYYVIESCFMLICIRKKVNFKVRKPFSDERLRKLLKLSLPLFVSYGVVQIQGIVDKAIASGLSEGSISALSYSGYLYNSTHSILIGGLCTVIFSYFSTYVVEKKEDLLLNTMYKYLKVMVLILAMITTLFVGYATDIVSIVYERGAFNQESVDIVALAFSAYSFGIVFIGIRDILIRAHYAYQNNKQAMYNGIIGVAVNIVMSIILSKYLGIAGIAFATSISSFCIAVISTQTIKRNIALFKISKLTSFFIKILAASMSTLFVAYFFNRYINCGLLLFNLMGKCILSMIIYLCVLKLLKCKEIDDAKVLILNKLRCRKKN